MRSTLLALLLIFGFTSEFALAQTKPAYYCTINGENPVKRGTYDQTLFAGEVLKNEAALTDVFLIKPDLRVIRAVDFASLSLSAQDLMTLDKSIFVSLSLSAPSLPDEKRTLTITLGRVEAGSGVFGTWNITSVTEGYHKGPLLIIDRALNIAVDCQR